MVPKALTVLGVSAAAAADRVRSVLDWLTCRHLLWVGVGGVALLVLALIGVWFFCDEPRDPWG